MSAISDRFRPLHVLVAVAGILLSARQAASQKLSPAEAQRRARQLVAQMTLDEKIAQVHGIRDEDHYRLVPALPRLHIPELDVTNGPAGVGPGGAGSQKPATALPAPIALAASWDTQLAFQYGELAATEARALGNTLLESPDINIARVPQGGRVFEGYGEDPFLVSRLAVANIDGIQSTGMIANVKHYLANNQETDRGTINEVIAERPLREIYMPAFEASVKEAHVASLMCAYPKVNGAFNCENAPLLTKVLKQEWGFDGFVTSDFGAVHSTVPSALAGLDLELPTGISFGADLKKAVQAGTVPNARLDEMLIRRYAKMMQLGWFGRQAPPKPIPAFLNGAKSRDIAERSMVLLKNEGHLLPLDRDHLKRIALIGPFAVRQMTGGGGSSHVIPLYSVAPVDGLDAALLSQTRIDLLDGTDIEAAAAAAHTADVAILMVGDDEGEDHDHGIDLPPAQNRLIAAVANANPKAIVVLKSGSAVMMPWIDVVPAVLEAWYPGEEDGNAVAAILLGRINPSGKLPITFPSSTAHTLAAFPAQFPGDGTTVTYSEGLRVGYRAVDSNASRPLFPFGFGLSYTTFSFSALIVRASPHTPGATATFNVTNTGNRTGAEVAQLYLKFPPIVEGDEPPLQLKGFQKVTLAPGQSATVTLTLNQRALSYWSPSAHRWQVPPGDFGILVGDSSADTPLLANLHLP